MLSFLLAFLFWNPSFADTTTLSSACARFDQVVRLESADTVSGFQMDQIVVHRNGKTLYAWADGAYKVDSLHSLWSGSKTIAATLAGAAIQQGRLSLDSKLKDFFPRKLADQKQQAEYDAITIENLINMSSGYVWDESYEADPVKSSFMDMIYGKGNPSMAQFALAEPLEISPGLKFNYSGGNANILMAVLKKIYGNTHFPQDLLFKKLGIEKAFFEQDTSGNLIGSSYAYFTPEEMARVGELFLQNGNWNGEQILPPNWVAQAGTLSEPLKLSLFSGNKKYQDYIKNEGIFSNRSFWLNQDIPQLAMKHEFPHSPANMFFAAGHYGQLLIILPTENIVIAATGHNKEYWSKIDKLVSNALACFAPESHVEPGSSAPPPPDPALGLKKELALGSGVLRKGYLQAILAKEMCSCTYVSGLTLNQCLQHANLPFSLSQLHLLISIQQQESEQSLRSTPTPVGEMLGLLKAHRKTAKYFGEGVGCRLVP